MKKLSCKHFLLITLLSALLFNSAFFFSDQLGILVIFACVLLWSLFFQQQHIKTYARAGALWGLAVYVPHFAWLYILLKTKSCAPWWLAWSLYGFVVCYATIITVFWFVGTAALLKILPIKKSTIGTGMVVSLMMFIYFFFLNTYCLWFVGKAEGYPFINPLIPLARYTLFFKTFSYICTFITYGVDCKPPEIHDWNMVYLKPVERLTSQHLSKSAHTQHVFHQLSCVAADFPNANIVVAPESFFPYPLKTSDSVISLWGCALPKGVHFLFGGCLQDSKNHFYQAIFHLYNGKIVNYYKKKHCVPFVEKMPAFFEKCTILRTMFLRDSYEMCQATKDVKHDLFTLESLGSVAPLICSELFYCHHLLQACQDQRGAGIFFFVNDSWFVEYFRKIMENLAYIKTAQLQNRVLWVGHFSCKKIL
ncbi:MAG: hypothetical protein V1855_01110 [bacterium]